MIPGEEKRAQKESRKNKEGELLINVMFCSSRESQLHNEAEAEGEGLNKL